MLAALDVGHRSFSSFESVPALAGVLQPQDRGQRVESRWLAESGDAVVAALRVRMIVIRINLCQEMCGVLARQAHGLFDHVLAAVFARAALPA
jgi:ABC-type antimicrobial peptide transport system permease subunit